MKRLTLAIAALAAVLFTGGADASPPDRIMFGRGSTLVTAALDGSDVQPVTPDDGYYRQLADWSPDGKRIVYTKFLDTAECGNGCPELRQLWVLDLAKGTERRITDTASRPFGFAWSPNGRRIAYSAEVAPRQVGNENASVSSSDPGVWVVNADGSGARLVAPGHSPSWSPEGDRVAFVCGTTLCIAAVDGGGAAPIPGTDTLHSPDWSPDGTALLAGRNAVPGTGVGPETVVLSPTGEIEAVFPKWVSARWTPDGASFAFLRSPAVRMLGDVCLPDPCAETEGVWLADRDGSNLRRVTNGSNDYHPQFAR